ncbi:MAG: alpha/beta hydrolase [Chlorobiaceae bacterium]
MLNRIQAHDVHVYGKEGNPVMIFAHGLGGNQGHWDSLVEHFSISKRVVTFALAGSPAADPNLFSAERHANVLGFADDLSILCSQLGIRGAIYVGHSISAMAGLLAASVDPGLFSGMILLNGSACYIDDLDSGYIGGFSREQIDEILNTIVGDFLAWSSGFAKAIMGNPDRPEFAEEFARSLSSYDPDVSLVLFRTAFTSDFRSMMPKVLPPVLILQNNADPGVPVAASEWLAGALPNSRLELLESEGHFPHIVSPSDVIARIEAFLPKN